MAIGVEVVDFLLLSASAMEFVFIEHERDLMRGEAKAERAEVIGILSIEQAVPGVARPSGFENVLLVGRTTEHVEVSQVIGKDHVWRRQIIGVLQILITHERQVVVVFLHIDLQRDADLVEVAETGGAASHFFAAADSGEQQARECGHEGDDQQEFHQREGARVGCYGNFNAEAQRKRGGPQRVSCLVVTFGQSVGSLAQAT